MTPTANVRLQILTIPYDSPAIISGRRRWTLALIGAVALHLVLVLGTYLRLGRPPDPPSPAPIEAILVDLSVQPFAPPRPADARPPGPEAKDSPAQTASAAHSRTDQPPPDPRGVLPPSAQRAVASQETLATQASTPREATAPPSIADPPAPTFAAPRTSAASTQNAAVTWRGLLLGRLRAYRQYPRRAQSAGQEGVVQVAFTVDRRGTVLGARIARGSGYPLLDDEALATVRKASPLPPPPDDVPGDPVEVMVPVDFFVR